MLVNVVLSITKISAKVLTYFTGFLGDYFIIMMYGLAAWSFFAAGQSPESYMQDLVDIKSMTFRIPWVAIVSYLVITYILYRALYYRVTTYTRWMYAFRVFLLMIFPLVALSMLITLVIVGQSYQLISGTSEAVGLIMGLFLMLFLSWAFSGFAYIISVEASTDSTYRVVPKSLLFPRQMFAILIQRKSDFIDPGNHPKQMNARFRARRRIGKRF